MYVRACYYREERMKLEERFVFHPCSVVWGDRYFVVVSLMDYARVVVLAHSCFKEGMHLIAGSSKLWDRVTPAREGGHWDWGYYSQNVSHLQ